MPARTGKLVCGHAEKMRAAARQFDCIILGAGAAGLMCASVAAQRGRSVAIVDHNAQPGRKILISGGGRCNFTNLHTRSANFHSQNPHFAKSALALYQPRHFLELVDRYRIPWHEKTLGQLFCDHSARAVVEMLLAECAAGPGSVEFLLDTRIDAVESSAAGYRVMTSRGELQAGSLVVATGGLSIPKMGATGLGYELARQFGLNVVATRPALVPLILGGSESCWTELAGVAVKVTAETGAGSRTDPRHRFREKMLFTHRGLSGPAILQISSYLQPGAALRLDFAPGEDLTGQLLAALKAPRARRDAATLRQLLHGWLPQRLAQFLAEQQQSWSNSALDALERQLRQWTLTPVGNEGYEKAEVTAGGVDTACLQARSLEARNLPGLFFIGEVVDVTGQLGGFNFQWAWSSAVAAGRTL